MVIAQKTVLSEKALSEVLTILVLNPGYELQTAPQREILRSGDKLFGIKPEVASSSRSKIHLKSTVK